jgi:hypothetical protein
MLLLAANPKSIIEKTNDRKTALQLATECATVKHPNQSLIQALEAAQISYDEISKRIEPFSDSDCDSSTDAMLMSLDLREGERTANLTSCRAAVEERRSSTSAHSAEATIEVEVAIPCRSSSSLRKGSSFIAPVHAHRRDATEAQTNNLATCTRAKPQKDDDYATSSNDTTTVSPNDVHDKIQSKLAIKNGKKGTTLCDSVPVLDHVPSSRATNPQGAVLHRKEEMRAIKKSKKRKSCNSLVLTGTSLNNKRTLLQHADKVMPHSPGRRSNLSLVFQESVILHGDERICPDQKA